MTLIPLMLLVAIIVIAVTLLLTAHAILRPPRMTDGKAIYVLKRLAPMDLGMHFELASFKVRDERTGQPLELAAWWIPHPAGGDKTVILIHGYADAKVGSIAWGPTWQQLGYQIMAIDLRAHGESAGKFATAGYFERHDLDQVISQLRAQHPQQTRQVVLFGISLGAAVALATAELRDHLDAVVLESPYATFANAVRADAKLLELPLPGFLPLAVRIAQWLSGADFNQVDPLRAIPSVKCPIMVIQSGDDALVSQEDAKAIESALSRHAGVSEHWLVSQATHLQALAVDPAAYGSHLRDFLTKAHSHRLPRDPSFA